MARAAQVTFVDGLTQKVTRTVAATDLPERQRYVETDGGRAAVVKVVTTRAGARTYIREYGAMGELLRSTVAATPPGQGRR